MESGAGARSGDVKFSNVLLAIASAVLSVLLSFIAWLLVDLQDSETRMGQIEKSFAASVTSLENTLREEIRRVDASAAKTSVIITMQEGLQKQIDAKFEDLADRIQVVRDHQAQQADWHAIRRQ